MTPLKIQMALAHHGTPAPREWFSKEVWNSPAANIARRWLVEAELTYHDGTPTDKLEAYVKHLCDTPLPVAQWVKPEEADNG